MELGEKLKELEVTAEEVERLGSAFREDGFRELFHQYCQELSDPGNKARFEEEIAILERERGNTVEFIHPEAFRAVSTCVDGSHRGFINICSSQHVGRPSSTPRVMDDGRRGLCWALPHILHPEAQEIYRKGRKVTAYDVVFHPDTLRMASRNKRFMDMVVSTAIQGIQSAFNVTLDRNNAREIRARCVGAPQTCVIRKPIPGFKKPAGEPDRLDFPYPDEKARRTSVQTNPTGSPVTAKSCGAVFDSQPLKTNEPTKPNYTLKYRSYVDIQDFRCSRNSAQSPRPKEIVVTIDVPLLKDLRGARVEAADRTLLLESEEPAYRLQLPLAYPVDEDKAEAKFNRQKGQLTVTLPVLSANDAPEFGAGPAPDDDRQVEQREVEDAVKVEEEGPKEESEGNNEEEEGPEEESEGNDEEEEGPEEQSQGKYEEVGLEKVRDGDESRSEEEGSVEEELHEEQRQRGLQCDTDIQRGGASETESQTRLEVAEHPGCSQDDGDAALNSFLESPSETRPSDVPEEMENGPASLKEEATSSSPHNTGSKVAEDDGASQQARESIMDEASEGRAGNEIPEEHSGSPQKQEREDMDEDDLPAEQEPGDRPAPALLIEVDEHGNETVISDHSTSAGFTFQNSLIYELD